MGNVLKSSYIDVHEAARCGHIEEVRRWIDDGKPVNARDNTQKTPLHHAAQWGQEETLDLLVSCGADVNATDFIEDTPLHFACYFGHANCVRNLTKAGAKVDAQDCYGNTPLRIFDDHVTEPVVDEIRLVVREVTRPPRHRQPSNSSMTTSEKLPPIPATSLRTGGDSGYLQAANYGHLATNKNATRPDGKLGVFTAARDNKVSVLKKALEDGENIDARDNKGLTLLMRAARAGRLSTVKFLVSRGAKLGLKDTVTGFTALHFASYHCRDSVVRILILAGADTKVRDKYGMLPGESVQPLSYLSFTALQRRRAIGRFLSGDLQDEMDDKGKNMFPMNAPLEAYDGDHKPQYLRHENSNMLCASSEADINTAYVGDSFRDDRKGTHSPPAGDSIVKYSLRKTSMQGLLFISNKLYGIYGESCNSTGEARYNDGDAAIIVGAQGDLRLDLAEAGQWRPRDTENGKTAEMGRRVPLKHHDGATNLAVHLNAKGGSHRSSRSRDDRRRSGAGQVRASSRERFDRERSDPWPYDPASAVPAASARLPRHKVTCTRRIERDTSEITSLGGSTTARVKKDYQDVSRSSLLPPSSLESIGNLYLEQGALAGHLSPLHQIIETQSMSSKTDVSGAPSNHKQENRALKIDSRGERSDRKRRHRHRKHKRGRHRERKERDNDSSSPHRHRKHKRGRHRERKERGNNSSSPHRHRKHKRTDQKNRSSSSRRNRIESDAGDRLTSCDMTAVGDVQHTLYPTSPTAKNLAPLKRVPRQIHSGLSPTQISQSMASALSPVTSTHVKGSDSHGDDSRVVADTGPLLSEAGGSEASLCNEASHM